MISNDEFITELKEKTACIETLLREYLPKKNVAGEYQQTLLNAMNYSMLAGGKRLRPLLMGELYRYFGGDEQVILPFQAAIEMIHTFSLVHDDLPCMDNDRYRRGQLTTWAVFGEDMATLAGDALSLYAFEVAGRGFSMSMYPNRVGRAMTLLAKEAGVYGMCGGQSVDVELTGKALDDQQLNFIYQLKTGALLRASMAIGAILAGAEEEELELVNRMAENIGMAFQIRDDILDVTSTEEVLGKPIGSDEKNHKTTYVTLHDMEGANRMIQACSREAITILDTLSRTRGKDLFLEELIRMLINRNK